MPLAKAAGTMLTRSESSRVGYSEPKSSPGSEARSWATAHLDGQGKPQAETWLVEVLETSTKLGNSDTLRLVAADRAQQGHIDVHVLLITVATSVPCGLGFSLPAGKVDKKRIKAHEAQVFKDHVEPLLSTTAGKKLKPLYSSTSNSKRNEGLKELVQQAKAQRLYVQVKKNSTMVENLALVMPGGCTVIGVSQGKKVAQSTAATVDVFDSCNTEPIPCNESALPQGAITWRTSEGGHKRITRRMSMTNIEADIEYFESPGVDPPDVGPSTRLSVDYSFDRSASAAAGHVASSVEQSPIEPDCAQGSLSAQFYLQRAHTSLDNGAAMHHSGPFTRTHAPNAPCLPSPPLRTWSTEREDTAAAAPSSASARQSPALSPLASASVGSSQSSGRHTDGSPDVRGGGSRFAVRANSAKEKGVEAGMRDLRKMLSVGQMKQEGF